MTEPIPTDLHYTSEHEWVRAEDGHVRVGVTEFAQNALGDIVYVDLPAVGTQVRAGEIMGEIESTKSVSDLFAPLDGTVSAINPALGDDPALVNRDPFGDGWLCLLDTTDDPSELLDHLAYAELMEG